MYALDDDENPGVFTVAGILVTLLLGAGAFYLLYTALATPVPPAADLLASSGATPQRTALPTTAPTSAPTERPPAIGVAPTVAPTAASTPTQFPATATVPPPDPSPTLGRVTPTAPLPTYLEVVTDDVPLNVRRRPNAEAAVLERVQTGELVEDLGTTRRAGGELWRRIRTSSGASGWASDEFLRPLE